MAMAMAMDMTASTTSSASMMVSTTTAGLSGETAASMLMSMGNSSCKLSVRNHKLNSKQSRTDYHRCF
jgi:hypothetical protein